MELALARDERFQRAARLVSVRSFAEAMQMLSEHREMLMFISRDSGYLALLAVLSSALDSGDQHVARVAYQDIAGRFGVSRTHIRDLFEAAEITGLVKVRSEGGSEIEILPALLRYFDSFLAACMELFDRDCTSALREITATDNG